MTINMLIVDDEPIICRGLRETIPWETIGVEVVGEAGDGAEALELIGRQSVDIVLTDIHMDGMDGIALSRELKKRLPQVRIIILSGYDHFEYARQAIRIGVEDYLLKPVNVSELMGMVQRIGGEIASEAEGRRNRQRESWLNWLTRLLQGGGAMPDPELLPGDSDEMRTYQIVASQLQDYALWIQHVTEGERQSARKAWEQEVQAALSHSRQEAISLFHHPNLLLTLCIQRTPVPRSSWEEALRDVKGPAPDGHPLHFGVSRAFQPLSEVYACCEEAVSLVQQNAVAEGKLLRFHEEGLREHNPAIATPAEWEKQLVNLLFNGSYEELDEVLGRLAGHIQSNGYLLTEVVRMYKELRVVVLRRLRTSGIEVSGEIDGMLTRDIDQNVHNCYRALEALIRSELMLLFSLIHSSLGARNHWTIERVKKYIDSRFSTDLKASDVAAWLKITPNYFSMIFKQHFGKGFAEYLNEVRIEHAKAFLSDTHDRVFEIADKVGYKEYKYFCSIFKTYTGVTPTQYRKLAEVSPGYSLLPARKGG
ncbi:response regulator transcription factor [Paenibacillus filicis]|uniref:Response regulator transcription factor n=1 Tax=Paenibacillus gyeongsangnamensis TaxID=3388067 RepID=A0ABT4QE80_9BACL|nr:response regulator transcription factor [Paenibacillus filicis]MCZ8515186.1 response regulator transcription factor [Paenibacillus filicis]